MGACICINKPEAGRAIHKDCVFHKDTFDVFIDGQRCFLFLQFLFLQFLLL